MTASKMGAKKKLGVWGEGKPRGFGVLMEGSVSRRLDPVKKEEEGGRINNRGGELGK